MPNKVFVFDGSQWLEQTPQIWNGTAWEARSPLYFDGVEWRDTPIQPKEFPSYTASTKDSYAGADRAELVLPSDLRTNDFVVSVCAQQDGEDRSPRLLAPLGVQPTELVLLSGMRFSVAVWPWEPAKGRTVVWDTTGSDNTAVMNLIYRYGDVTNTSLMPVSSLTEATNTNRVTLPASDLFTSLYVVMVVSTNLTGVGWPQGVISRAEQYGQFGTKRISLLAADTPGAGASPGDLMLDTTAESVVTALLTIPGRSDGNPTWILGDASNSTLGQTTYLG
ncbi:hypothetical protein [Streptomyces sp. URMC 125]|uniref:hypothetical protein n=1 Tax=Streptomyces sp. URMC 125 TaxID=3423419 RepID=UPI003F1A1272